MLELFLMTRRRAPPMTGPPDNFPKGISSLLSQISRVLVKADNSVGGNHYTHTHTKRKLM
jgi:hypothetical protein